jgi:NAD-dependent SIR2 family protein deacetylase
MMSPIQQSEDDKIKAAATAIAKCDFLVIATGAGFSADSGLPTYTHVAQNPVYLRQDIDYSDLCRIACLTTRPSLFYGFWGSCYNAYQQATPHEGYAILKQWCDKKETNDSNNSPYFLYTSNVDGHLRRSGFSTSKIHEIHGSIDTWLVLDSSLNEPISKSPRRILLPPDFRFSVCQESLELDHATLVSQLGEVSPGGTLPPTSPSYRPSVLMFDDGIETHDAMGLRESSDRYQAWEEWMESEMASRSSAKLVVLEVGCGVRVPSVRQECYDIVHDTASRCLNKTEKRCTHIRINPEEFAIDPPMGEFQFVIETISIQGGALSTLRLMDEALRRLPP